MAKTLTDRGMTLRAAHAVIDRLVEGASHGVELVGDDVDVMIAQLGDLDVSAIPIRRPSMDPKAVRLALGLSQRDFALRFGLELRTIQNWEQEHHRLDAAASILLALIEQSPLSVEQVLTSPVRTSAPTDAI